MASIVDLIKRIFVIIKEKQKKEADKMNVREVEELEKDAARVERQFDVGKNKEHFLEEFGYETPAKRRLMEIKLDPEWV